VCLIFLLVSFSCKNTQKTILKKESLMLLETIKTPMILGAGRTGVKISLRIEKLDVVYLDSIVYNGKSSEVNEEKKESGLVWFESYFYSEKKMTQGKGVVEYKAEGDSCMLFYRFNDESKSILIPALKTIKDNTLWK
tara:strand:- start:101 stop:511 length:411 start_codon:yes stop_codon:yes gene_type:complete